MSDYWPRIMGWGPMPGLRHPRRRSTATLLMGSLVRIPLRAWIFVCCVCRVVLGSGFCDELIIRPEESYCVCVCVCVCVCLIVCDLETSTVRLPRPELGYGATEEERQDFSMEVRRSGDGFNRSSELRPRMCT